MNTISLARSSRLWMIFILGALASFGPFSIDMYLPALPKLAGDLHTNTSLAQASLTACLLGLSLGQLIAGSLSDVHGRRIPLLVGLIIYAAASILCVFSSSIWVFIALRFIQGLSGAAGIVLSRAVVRDLYSGTELTKFFSLLMLVNGVAPIIAPIIGGQLLQVTSWRGVFIALCLLGVIMLIAVLFGLPETLPEKRRSKGGFTHTLSTFKRMLGDRVFMGYALSQGLVFAAMFAYISGSPFVLQTIFGVSPQMFSVFFAINGIGIIIAGQITGWLAGKVSETRMLITGLFLSALGGLALLVMILIGAGLVPILIPLFIAVSCVGIVAATSFSLAMENYGESAGSASALLGLLSLIFGSVVAPLVGLGGSGTAVPMGIVIAVAEVGAIASYFFLVRPGKSSAVA
jgi:DHA1 family bicyclomycin/chloramphenicol resistance-like MFS transporter